jgi:hypothetical protein
MRAREFFEFRTVNNTVNGHSVAALASFLLSASSHHTPLASFADFGRRTSWSPSLLTPMDRSKSASSIVRSKTDFVMFEQRQQNRWLVAESKIRADVSLRHSGQIVMVGIVQTIQARTLFVKAGSWASFGRLWLFTNRVQTGSKNLFPNFGTLFGSTN